MASLNEPVAKRIGRLFRMLGSTFEGERRNSVAAMKKLLTDEGLSFNDIATVIESCNGQIDERKYSDADAEIIFARGVEKGRIEEARKKEQIVPSDYYDDDGHPRWDAIAMFCLRNNLRLRPNEQKFVDEMAANTVWREPTERQAKWLLSIFIKLGGRRTI